MISDLLHVTRMRPLALTNSSRRLACVAAATLWLPAPARAGGRTLAVGPGERLRSLAEAVRAAVDGDTIELQPGDYRGDVTAISQRGLTVRGLGDGAVLHADGQHAEGKAIVVARGDITMDNVEFRGCRVPSGNGAGIRFERGRLQLRRCRFHDNEMGLLSASEPDMALQLVDCEFGSAPRHPGLLHHLLYVGEIGSFHVQGSRFEQGYRGHLLKSRARRSTVLGNWLVDGPLGEASYELEFPNGGDNLVAGNVIAQSTATQNPTIVSMGAEAGPGFTGRLRLVHNTLVNHAAAEARFVQVWTERLPGNTLVWMANNLFAGPGQSHLPDEFDGGGNRRVALDALTSASSADYRLAVKSPLLGSAAPIPGGLPTLLEFTAPRGTRSLPNRPLSPGALQSER